MKRIISTNVSVQDPEFKALEERLKSIGLIPESELTKLAMKVQIETYDKKDLFLKRFEQPTRIAFVISGLFRVYYMGPTGTPLVKTFCREGSFVEPELASFRSLDSDISIEALEKSKVISISVQDAMALLANNPAWLVLARTILEEQLSAREKREFQLLALDAYSRYELFLKEFPGLETRITQLNIASYLGITPVSLNRLLRRQTR